MDYTLQDGKFKGSTLAQVLSTYKGYTYLQYLHQLQPDLMIPRRVWQEIDTALGMNPQPPPCSPDEAAQFVLRFGKHKGQTLGHLARSIAGQGYLTFLCNKPDMFPDVKHHASIVLRNTPLLLPTLPEALQTRITFGKFTGRSIADVCKSYRGRIYIEWLLLKPKSSTPYLIQKALQVTMDQLIRPEGHSLAPAPEDEAFKLRFGLFRGQRLSDLVKRPDGRSWMRSVSESRYATWVQSQEIKWYLANIPEPLRMDG
jgi:uncharacterized protein (DUF3820 family)